MTKLLLLMVDGISADHYQHAKHLLPHFSAIDSRGFRIKNLKSEALGVSLPGRTSILTGATADINGIYGNSIWDGEKFRYATPDDVRVPTLAHRAKNAGLRVANIGLGMVRPDDSDIYVLPWWAGEMIQRGRDATPQEAGDGWLRALHHPLDAEFVKLCENAGLPTTLPAYESFLPNYGSIYGLYADHRMMDWVAMLATSQQAPDVILTEFLVTDSFLHYTGYRSDLAQWSLEQADMAFGKIMTRLQQAGVADEWNIVILSDHGHSAIETAIFAQRLLPDTTLLCEGSSLIVAPKDAQELATITAKLAEYNAQPYPNDCIPTEWRDKLFLFMAPDGYSFESVREGEDGITGKPSMISSHGLRPGATGDDRFALFAGASVPQGRVDHATATQIAPTLAKILGLPTDDFSATPIF
jgi:predicted AlkP superfamily pyrophosphatase or phosphodiesterase